MSFSEIRSRILSLESHNPNPIAATAYEEKASLARSTLAKLFGPSGFYEQPITVPLTASSNLDDFSRSQKDKLNTLRQAIRATAGTCLTAESYDWFIKNFSEIFSDETIFNNLIPAKGTLKFQSGASLTLDGRRKFFKFINQFITLSDSPTLSSLVEEIRLAQSQVSLNRTLQGTLRLSILPEDYLTLSEETTGWHTCLSLFPHSQRGTVTKRPGDYRMGCLEMLTSPYAITASILSSDGRKYWRQLILFTPEIIVGLRGYPYNAEQATTTALSILSTLASRNLNWHYSREIHTTSNNCFPVAKHVWMEFTTNNMYNDAYLGGYYVIRNEEEFPQPLLPIEYNYSGPALCLSCGKRIDTLEDGTSEILCEECSHRRKCYCCGERKDLDSLLFDKDLEDYVCFYCNDKIEEEKQRPTIENPFNHL